MAKAGLPPMHPEIVKLLGRLHFRHSYAQNMLDHSVEVAHLMGLMAAELGVDVSVRQARRLVARHRQGGEPRGRRPARGRRRGIHQAPRRIRRGGQRRGVASQRRAAGRSAGNSRQRGGRHQRLASRRAFREHDHLSQARGGPGENRRCRFPAWKNALPCRRAGNCACLFNRSQVNDEEAFALARNIATKIENELAVSGTDSRSR